MFIYESSVNAKTKKLGGKAKVEQTVEKTTDDTENQLKRKKLLNVQSVKRKCVRNA
jgi:uncharacterized membrane protein